MIEFITGASGNPDGSQITSQEVAGRGQSQIPVLEHGGKEAVPKEAVGLDAVTLMDAIPDTSNGLGVGLGIGIVSRAADRPQRSHSTVAPDLLDLKDIPPPSVSMDYDYTHIDNKQVPPAPVLTDGSGNCPNEHARMCLHPAPTSAGQLGDIAVKLPYQGKSGETDEEDQPIRLTQYFGDRAAVASAALERARDYTAAPMKAPTGEGNVMDQGSRPVEVDQVAVPDQQDKPIRAKPVPTHPKATPPILLQPLPAHLPPNPLSYTPVKPVAASPVPGKPAAMKMQGAPKGFKNRPQMPLAGKGFYLACSSATSEKEFADKLDKEEVKRIIQTLDGTVYESSTNPFATHILISTTLLEHLRQTHETIKAGVAETHGDGLMMRWENLRATAQKLHERLIDPLAKILDTREQMGKTIVLLNARWAGMVALRNAYLGKEMGWNGYKVDLQDFGYKPRFQAFSPLREIGRSERQYPHDQLSPPDRTSDRDGKRTRDKMAELDRDLEAMIGGERSENKHSDDRDRESRREDRTPRRDFKTRVSQRHDRDRANSPSCLHDGRKERDHQSPCRGRSRERDLSPREQVDQGLQGHHHQRDVGVIENGSRAEDGGGHDDRKKSHTKKAHDGCGGNASHQTSSDEDHRQDVRRGRRPRDKRELSPVRDHPEEDRHVRRSASRTPESDSPPRMTVRLQSSPRSESQLEDSQVSKHPPPLDQEMPDAQSDPDESANTHDVWRSTAPRTHIGKQALEFRSLKRKELGIKSIVPHAPRAMDAGLNSKGQGRKTFVPIPGRVPSAPASWFSPAKLLPATVDAPPRTPTSPREYPAMPCLFGRFLDVDVHWRRGVMHWVDREILPAPKEHDGLFITLEPYHESRGTSRSPGSVQDQVFVKEEPIEFNDVLGDIRVKREELSPPPLATRRAYNPRMDNPITMLSTSPYIVPKTNIGLTSLALAAPILEVPIIVKREEVSPPPATPTVDAGVLAVIDATAIPPKPSQPQIPRIRPIKSILKRKSPVEDANAPSNGVQSPGLTILPKRRRSISFSPDIPLALQHAGISMDTGISTDQDGDLSAAPAAAPTNGTCGEVDIAMPTPAASSTRAPRNLQPKAKPPRPLVRLRHLDGSESSASDTLATKADRRPREISSTPSADQRPRPKKRKKKTIPKLDSEDLKEQVQVRLQVSARNPTSAELDCSYMAGRVVERIMGHLAVGKLKYRGEDIQPDRLDLEDRKLIKEHYADQDEGSAELSRLTHVVGKLGSTDAHKEQIIEYYLYHRDRLAKDRVESLLAHAHNPRLPRKDFAARYQSGLKPPVKAESPCGNGLAQPEQRREAVRDGDIYQNCPVCHIRLKGSRGVKKHRSRVAACGYNAVAPQSNSQDESMGPDQSDQSVSADPALIGEEQEAPHIQYTASETAALLVAAMEVNDDDEMDITASPEAASGDDGSAGARIEASPEPMETDRKAAIPQRWKFGMTPVKLDKREARNFAEYSSKRFNLGWQDLLRDYQPYISATLLTRQDLKDHYMDNPDSFHDVMDEISDDERRTKVSWKYKPTARCQGCTGHSPSLAEVFVGIRAGAEEVAKICQLCRKGVGELHGVPWEVVEDFFNARRALVDAYEAKYPA